MASSLPFRPAEPGINTYLLQMGVKRYGNRDAEYRGRTFAVMTEASRMIRDARESGKVSKELFYRIFDLFSRTRGEMARDFGLAQNEEYGRRRDDAKAHQFTYTALSDEYEAAGRGVREIASKYLEQLAGGKQVRKGNDDSQFHIRLVTPDESEVFHSGAVPEGSDPEEPLRMYSMFKAFEEEYPKFKEIWSLPKDQRPHFVLCETKMKLNGKLLPVAHYINVLDPAFIKEPNIFVNKSKTIVFHMDRRYIEDGLEQIGELFVRCVQAPKENLMAAVAQLRTTYTHVTPTERGTCAIGEWLENALFHSVTGNFVTYKPNELVELTAFSKPYIPNFVKAYQKLVICPGLPKTT